jgi:Leucine-rich repeat (LRR) protein
VVQSDGKQGPPLTPANKKIRASLMKLLASRDFDTAASGCVMLQAMADDEDLRPIVEELADGSYVDINGRLVIGLELETWEKAAAHYLPAVFWGNRTMVAIYALAASERGLGVVKLDLSGDYSHPNFRQNIDGLANMKNLTNLDLSYSNRLQNIDVICKLKNLTNLNLLGCSALQNIDGLANLHNLTKLDLSWCSSLQNIDAVANLHNLTSLNVYCCSSLQNIDAITIGWNVSGEKTWSRSLT